MKTFAFDENLRTHVTQIIDSQEKDKLNLLAMLLEIQSIIPEQYIPVEVAEFISDELDIHLSKIYDVITFYSALSDKPRAQHVIQLCKSTACTVNKYHTLQAILERELGIKVGEKTSDGKFAIEYSACFGACDISPAFRIGEYVYGNLTEKKAKEIIENYRRM